ncbi:MAG: hypothetical protein AB7F75_06435 [Planctomycetota bacterium]
MKAGFRVTWIAALVSLCAADGSRIAEGWELALDQGLEAAGLTRVDLAFERIVVTSTDLPARVREALVDPLAHLAWARKTRTEFGTLSASALGASLPSLVGWTPERKGASESGSMYAQFPESEHGTLGDILACLPSSVRSEVGSLLGAMRRAQTVCRQIPWDDALLRGAHGAYLDEWKDTQGRSASPEDFKAFTSMARARAGSLQGPSLNVLEAVEKLSEALRKTTLRNELSFHHEFKTSLGLVVISGRGDDRHHAETALVVDLGGDDLYEAGACASPGLPVSVVVDAGGHDRYRSKESGQGGALGGCAILWDMEGDDVYQAGTLAQGAAVLGMGILVDEAGHDTYQASQAAQGHGAWGTGFLFDAAGRDSYRAGRDAQGMARTLGVGLLEDREGNDLYLLGGERLHKPLFEDQYLCFGQGAACGYRYEELAGGIGILHDGAGNDEYLSDIYGQAVGYWFSVGHLWEEGGNDRYSCVQYGTCAGIHQASGYLLDLGGNDVYTIRNGIGVGGAHDLSTAVLFEGGGNDTYVGGSTAMGGAINNSVALLIDLGGNDTYLTGRPEVQVGMGTPSRNLPSLGIQVDVGGEDSYRSGGADDQIRVKPGLGLSIDLHSKPPEEGSR